MRMVSEVTREKLRKAQRGRFHFPSTKKKMSIVRKGRKMSEETKKRMSESKMGEKHFRYGKKHKEETIIKMSLAKRKNNHPNWLGGISFKPYTIDWTNTLKRSIRERDRYLCQLCFSDGNQVHHIDYDKKNCNIENLVTLCCSCHIKTNYNRARWIKYFGEINNSKKKIDN